MSPETKNSKVVSENMDLVFAQPLDKVAQSRSSKTVAVPTRLPLYGPLDVKNISRYLTESKEKFGDLYRNSFPFVVNPKDFEVMSLLGKGAFGKVLLVRNKNDKNVFAMKAMEKRHIIKTKQIPHALNEKRILQCIDFPFAVRMEYFAKDNSYIYFLMPFISGGEMFDHLQKLGRFSDSQSRFYAAQVVLGLEYLHHLRLVYRDLKPENLLIDHLGFLKITDFGFCKPVITRTYTFCGTPHYLAPEIISGHGYGTSCDWWSLGILIYEMNSGNPPFDNDDQMTMFKQILSNR